MTAIWMGLTAVARSAEKGVLELTANRKLVDRMQDWLGLSPFARQNKRAK